MSIKILTQNSIDNTNIDGARQNHFSAGMRSGIVKGSFNEGRFFASSSNIIALDTCELRLSGHRVIIDEVEYITLSNKPATPTRYSMIAEIKVTDLSVPTFRLFIQSQSTALVEENLFKTSNGSGIYQLRIGNFTLGTDGTISDVVRTVDLISGGANSVINDIKFNATVNQSATGTKPDVNIDYNEETGEYDMNLIIPAGGGTNVTLGDVIQNKWSSDFAESERAKSKNLFRFPYWDGGAGSVRTHNGITITVNEDSSINFNGTNNSLTTGSYIGIDYGLTLKSGTYTVSISHNDGNLLIEENGTWFKLLPQGATTHTFTLTEDKTFNTIYLMAVKGSTVDISNVFIQLEEGDTATRWQEYHGAIVHERDKTTKPRLLWSGLQSETGTVTLNTQMSNFTYLMFYAAVTDTTPYEYSTHMVVVENFKLLSDELLNIGRHDPVNYKWMNLQYVDDTTVNIQGIGSMSLVKVYGV